MQALRDCPDIIASGNGGRHAHPAASQPSCQHISSFADQFHCPFAACGSHTHNYAFSSPCCCGKPIETALWQRPGMACMILSQSQMQAAFCQKHSVLPATCCAGMTMVPASGRGIRCCAATATAVVALGSVCAYVLLHMCLCVGACACCPAQSWLIHRCAHGTWLAAGSCAAVFNVQYCQEGAWQQTCVLWSKIHRIVVAAVPLVWMHAVTCSNGGLSTVLSCTQHAVPVRTGASPAVISQHQLLCVFLKH
jgi:hypothetical protein